MIFYFGVGFCIGGLVLLIMLLRKMRRPKTEAIIQEVTLEYHEKDKRQLKKHPHALIAYNYKSVDYSAKILLLKRHLQNGDSLTVSLKDDNPEKPTMYAPKQEIVAIMFLFFLGLGVIAASVFIMDSFDLW
ncbi:MAG: hypothetical protein GQ574_09685 [Crocinitomix sp.]|nr:hypothetical protein [Crocinitomix sp.]